MSGRAPCAMRLPALFVVAGCLCGVFDARVIGQEPLSPFTSTPFNPDGEITEFISFPGNNQEYFITLPGDDFGAIKVGARLTRGVFVTRDNEPLPGQPNPAGPTGFGDRPCGLPPEAPTGAPTGFNIGRVFASYNPDAYGGEGAYVLAIDISAPAPLDHIAATVPRAFDLDGDGSRQTRMELALPGGKPFEAPTQSEDIYTFGLDVNLDNFVDLEFIVAERTAASVPFGSVAIDPNGVPQIINNRTVRRYVRFSDLTGLLPGDTSVWARFFLDANNDGVLNHMDIGVGSDVEMVIRNVRYLHNLLDLHNRPNTDPECVTFRYQADAFDDIALCGGAEDRVFQPVRFPVPDLEVKKVARCVGEPDSAFRDFVPLVPGSTVEFRITIENRGNRDLAVTIEDVLSCLPPAMAALVPGSCRVIGVPPPGIIAGFCDEFEAALNTPAGFPLALETFRAGSQCRVGLGDQLIFTFQVAIGPPTGDPAFCDEEFDCTNAVSVFGATIDSLDLILPASPQNPGAPEDGNAEEEDCDTAACCASIPPCTPMLVCRGAVCVTINCSDTSCVAGNGVGDVPDEFTVEVSDIANATDTRREVTAGADDNVVDIEIQCRGITLSKSVRLLPDGPFLTGDDPVIVPSAPARIEYHYVIVNNGEVDELATLRDIELCEDVEALIASLPGQISFGDCSLCNDPTPGELTAIVPAGGAPFQTSCTIQFETELSLRSFTRADETDVDCRAETPGGGSDVQCYRNCAHATSQATNLGGACPDGAVEAESSSKVCHPVCDVSVNKQVRCLDNCEDKNPAGPRKDLLAVTPGACVEYAVAIANTSTDTPICLLRIADTLSNQVDCISLDGSVTFAVDGTACAVASSGFNVSGAPFDWYSAECGLTQLAPGQTLTITFNAVVPLDADPACAPVNSVVVDAASDCHPTGQIGFTCSGSADAALDIRRPSLDCVTKEWAYQWDSDADCEPDPPFSAFSSTLDLRDKLFPVLLRLRVAAENTGDAPLDVTASDPSLSACVAAAAGVAIASPPACDLNVVKRILPGATGEWFCHIRVETAEAMRALDACDGAVDGVYSNTATVSGVLTSAGTNLCVTENGVIPGDSCSADILVPPLCDLTVAKKVKCVDDPDSAYADEVDALAGSTLRFRIQVTNTDDLVSIPRVCLTDTLGCRDWLVDGTVQATLGTTNVAACVASTFAASLDTGATECYLFASCRPGAPWIAPGETLTITFDVRVPIDFSVVGEDPDCANLVTAEGFPEACVPLPLPDDACDVASDSVLIDVLIPAIECEKLVRADLDNDGTFDVDFTGDIALPCDLGFPPDSGFPLRLEYRFTASNTGETPLVNAKICDGDLLADAVAAGLTVQPCDPTIALGGCSPVSPLAVDESFVRTCQIIVPTRAAFEAFAASDADDDEDCYSNSATAMAEVDTARICDFGAQTALTSDECSARVCLAPPCLIEVTKKVRCLNNCVDKSPIGPFQDVLQVTELACLEFAINIINTSDRVPVCRLVITDTLTGQSDHIRFEDNVRFRIDGGSCPVPGGFNVDGIPFTWDPANCGRTGLQPGETLTISFIASIPKGADPQVTPTNTVQVSAAGQCSGESAVFCCEGGADAAVDILRAALTCPSKEWAFQWDSDANCQPNSPFSDFASVIDLRDKVFPVLLRLRIRAANTGDVPLSVVVDDHVLAECVASTPGVSQSPHRNRPLGSRHKFKPVPLTPVHKTASRFSEPPTCELGTAKLLLPGSTAEWICEILVETAEAMRALDTCDGATDNVYTNRATVSGTMVSGPTGICVPPNRAVDGDQDCSAVIQVPPPCQLVVTKQIKCADDPFAEFAEEIETLPGSVLTYRIQVANTSPLVKLPRLCITDTLSCPAWLEDGTVTAEIAGTNVTACLAPIFAPSLITGDRECYAFAACRPAAPWIAPGETLTILFDVVVPADFSTLGVNPDCANDVMVEGFAEVCAPAGVADRMCDMGMGDAQIDVRLPKVECEKRVRADLGNNGSFDAELSADLMLPCDVSFPLRLEYQLTARNTGETALVDVQLCDAELIADATAAGLTISPCQLLPGPAGCSFPGPIPQGGSVTRRCEVIAPTRDAWTAFAGRDADGRPECYSNNSTAMARVDTSSICGFGADTSVSSVPCSARACLDSQCQLQISNAIRCLESCQTGNPAGALADFLPAAAGTCVEFRMQVTNASTDVSLCRLRITDSLTNQPGSILFHESPRFRVGTTECPAPPGFNVNGVPFLWDPGACGLAGLLPGQSLQINFRATIPGAADPAISPTNTLTVQGARDCPAGVPAFCCQSSASSQIDVRSVGLTGVSKEWAFMPDLDADCIPEGNFAGFSADIDLAEQVFPVLLRLRLRARNTGEVPLNVVANDPGLLACAASLDNVSLSQPPVCELGTSKLVPAGGTAEWLCDIRVNSSEGARALDTCDGAADGTYHNTASFTGTLKAGEANACLPTDRVIAGVNPPSADMEVPPTCDFALSRSVVCLNRCPNGFPSGTAAETLDVVPGASARYIIDITNTNPFVNIPRVCLTDVLSCREWFCPQAVTASLFDADNALSANVSADFAAFMPDGARRCFTLGHRTAAPWIAPGETLRITFDVHVPDDFEAAGLTPDCRNTVTIDAFAEACPSSPDLACDTKQGAADIDVRVPRLECQRTIAVDQGDNGTMDIEDAASLNLANPTYPLRLVYTITVRNTGELPIAGATICDDHLVHDARIVGIQVGPCSLCNEPACNGTGDTCASLGNLSVGASLTRKCEMRVANQFLWDAFAVQDAADTSTDCYTSVARARGTISPTCAPPGAAVTVESPSYETVACMSGLVECPTTKAKFDIWNQNEVHFSTERCVISWDEAMFSQYSPGNIGNHFLRSALQTDMGRARIDGVSSPGVCGQESLAMPLLGVASKLLNFGRNGVDRSGTTLIGAGEENGMIRYERSEPAINGGKGDGIADGDASPHNLAAVADVSATSEKGSLLVFAKVEVKWDVAGNLIQDSFIELSNDSDNPVRVLMYFVNGDQPLDPVFGGNPPMELERPHKGCNWVDNAITLRGNEPTYWSVATGDPLGVSPFSILDHGPPLGRPDHDPRNAGGRALRGYVLVWAVNANDVEIRWNSLTGSALIVNYRDQSAWQYNPWAFQAVLNVAEGLPLRTPFGQLDLDGVEYKPPPAMLLLDFYASGTVLGSEGNQVFIDTDLTLWAAVKDLRNP